jgi:hypothetical protein
LLTIALLIPPLSILFISVILIIIIVIIIVGTSAEADMWPKIERELEKKK